MDMYSNTTTGDWQEYAYADVITAILHVAQVPNLGELETRIATAKDCCNEIHADVTLTLSSMLQRAKDDAYLQKILEDIADESPISAGDAVRATMQATGKSTRDARAGGEGMCIPPHYAINGQLLAWDDLLEEVLQSSQSVQGERLDTWSRR